MTLISSMHHNNSLQAKPILPGTCVPAGSIISNLYLQFHDPNEFHKLHRVVHEVTKAGVVKQCRGGISTAAVLYHFGGTINKFFEST